MSDKPMTLTAAAEYLSYAGRSGVLKFLRARSVPMLPRGRSFLVRREDIDAALAKKSVGGDLEAQAREIQRRGNLRKVR